MAAESKVIQKLHYQVDNYDEQQEVLQSSEKLSEEMEPNSQKHVQLYSPNTNYTTIATYGVTFQREHGIMTFFFFLVWWRAPCVPGVSPC